MRIFLPNLKQSERSIAEDLARLNSYSPEKITPYLDPLFDEVQSQAVTNACTHPVSIVSGRPGTGKTTILGSVIRSFSKAGLTGYIGCPTGASRKRCETVVRAAKDIPTLPEFGTIHSITSKTHRHNKLECDYFVIDEGTMADAMIAAKNFESLNTGTRLVILGDPNQLPSVQPGKVVSDMIVSGKFNHTELKEIYRQGKNSGIVNNASRIIDGLPFIPIDPKTGDKFSDFFFVERTKPSEIRDSIVKYATETIPDSNRGFDRLKDIQVLSPGKKSECGTKELNKVLRDILNPKRDNSFCGFSPGDKVIYKKNRHAENLVNGDTGVVKDLGSKSLIVDFGEGAGPSDNGLVELDNELTEDMQLSYCFTIHSSQGCEFPCVILSLSTVHSMLLFKNLLYTGITRGRMLVVVVGSKAALKKCIATCANEQRQTSLVRELELAI